jgi:hypothetical protein
MRWAANGFGLGYADGPQGELSHYLWGETSAAEGGPYRILWMVYRTAGQFLELMALIKSLGDQVRLVTMREPPGIQLQDLLEKPGQIRTITQQSKYENVMRAFAYWQMRILDVPACLAQTRLPYGEVRFNLALSDPIESFLEEEAPWRGVAGEYIATLGPSSGAEAGTDPDIPTLEASVGAFTRMWLGVRPASGLAITDELSGPPELLEALDAIFRLPDPKPDWDF